MRQLTRPTQAAILGCRRLLLLAVPVLTLMTTVNACSKPPSNAPENIVILPSATANEPEPELSLVDIRILGSAATSSTKATAYVVNPTIGAAQDVPLTPRRPDGQVEYGPNRSSLITQNVQRTERILRDETASGPFDLLNAIASATRVTDSPGTLLIVSDGLSTAGGFDLRQVGWDANPAAVATQLDRRGILPRLAGWKVVFSGLGDTHSPQPALPLPQRTTLTRYWLALCAAAGAASCVADDMTRPDPAPRSTTPTPVVPVPEIRSVTGPRQSTGVSVPDDQLFPFDSARLVPGADSVLAPLAERARSGGQLVSITGYASPDGGTTTYNQVLSTQRALAVRARLLTLGLPASQIVSTRGLGTGRARLAACTVNGQFEEARCAQLRRVVVLLIPRK